MQAVRKEAQAAGDAARAAHYAVGAVVRAVRLFQEAGMAPEARAFAHRCATAPGYGERAGDALLALVDRSRRRHLGHGEVLVRRGERADTAYVVLDGNVRLEASGALLGEGDIVGGAEAARGVAWAGAVVAEGGASLLRIDPGLWTSTLPAHTEVRSLFEAVERERVLEGHRCTAPWFTGLRGGQRRALLARFEARRFRAGERILRAGVPALGFFVVTGGEVRVERGGAELARLRPAAHFGEISVLQGIPATADVVAQDDVECLVLSPNAFHAAMAFHPDQVDALAAVARARHATTALRVA